jgi:hypothetical protein
MSELDTREEELIEPFLPICVKEVLSNGPGIVYKLFLLEVSANNGTLMGSVDIADDEENIRNIAGSEYCSTLPMQKSDWNMDKIFEHIASERIIIDIEHSDVSHSQVNLIRDDDQKSMNKFEFNSLQKINASKIFSVKSRSRNWIRIHSRTHRIIGFIFPSYSQ